MTDDQHDRVERGRPALSPDAAEVFATWLTPNGIDGWLPEHAEIVVKDGQITYPAWRHLDGTVGGWGYDVMIERDLWADEQRAAVWTDEQRMDVLFNDGDPAGLRPVTEPCTVPLVVPLTDRVRELLAAGGVTLIEG